MKKEITVTSFVFLLFSTLAFNGFVVVKGEFQDLGFVIRTSVTFAHEEKTGNWTFTEEEKAISLFMNDTWQTVQLTSYSCPIERLKPDEDGNPLAVLKFPKSELNPGENVSYTVTYHLISKPRLLPSINEERSGNLREIPENLKEEYRKAEKNWLIDDPRLQELASNITKGETKVLTIVKNFVAWIRDNVEYPKEKPHEMPLYANETFIEKEGDCDDQAILLITLCRIIGIPAYLQVGCIYLPTMALSTETYWKKHVTVVSKRIGWHGWAIVYIPPWGWLPVDLTYVRGGLDEPLNAIRGAAVNMQTVIQYMNVSKTDYVASSRQYKEFLLKHGFYIHEQDEMISVSPVNLWNELIWRLLPLVFIAVVVPAVSVTIIGLVYITTRKKESKTVQTQTS